MNDTHGHEKALRAHKAWKTGAGVSLAAYFAVTAVSLLQIFGPLREADRRNSEMHTEWVARASCIPERIDGLPVNSGHHKEDGRAGSSSFNISECVERTREEASADLDFQTRLLGYKLFVLMLLGGLGATCAIKADRHGQRLEEINRKYDLASPK